MKFRFIIVITFFVNFIYAQTGNVPIRLLFENKFGQFDTNYYTNSYNEYTVYIYDKNGVQLGIFDKSNTDIDSYGFESNYYEEFTFNWNANPSLSQFPLKIKVYATFTGGSNQNSYDQTCTNFSNNNNPSYYDGSFFVYTDDETGRFYGAFTGIDQNICHGTTNITLLTINKNSITTKGKCEDILIETYYTSYDEAPLRWQYQIGNSTTWEYFPDSMVTPNNVFFKVEDIPGLENYTGNFKVRFEIDPLPVNVNPALEYQKNSYSSVMSYEIRNCTPLILAQDNPIDNLCSDSNNGSVKFTFDRPLQSNEYINFSYLINGFAPTSTPAINSLSGNNEFVLKNLPQGNYTDIVFTSNINGVGAQSTNGLDFIITAPSKLAFTIPTPAQILCKGKATGSITVNATGGTPPYQYSLDNLTWQTANVFYGLLAGDYTVYVKDANGCAPPDGVQTVTINEPPTTVFISNPVETNPILNNQSTGSIAIDVTDGVTPYSYSWTYDNPNGQTNTFKPTDEDITTLFAGTYTIVVTDANGCSATASFTLVDPPVLVPTINVDQDIKCFGASTGILSASASGGRPGYTYQWSKNGSFLSSNQQITNLNAGDYRLVVTDQDGLGGSQEVSYILTQPTSALVASVNAINSTCFGANDGSITITASGGTPFANPSPTYTYSWTKEGNPITNSTAFINNLAPGNYSCTITDQNGCTTTLNNITIEEPPVIEILFSNSTDLLDASNPTGAISVSAAGGLGTLTYSWDNNATTASISGLFAGTYTLTVTDVANSNCKLITPFTITAPPIFSIDIQQNNLINCFGNATASLEVISNGGTKGTAPNEYTYSWTGANIPVFEPTNTSTLSNLPAGTYNVQVRDANNILRTLSYIVTQPTLLTASYTKTNVTCSGLNNGSINLIPSGGTPNYTYEWKNQLNQVIAVTQNVANLASGSYSCTITDAKGCTFILNNIPITAPTPLVFDSENIIPVSTAIATDGSIEVVMSGGTQPYNYNWTKAGSSIGTNSPQLNNLSVGNYDLLVTDANGCTITDSYLITVLQPLTATIQEITSIDCNGNLTGSIKVNPTGGLPPYTFLWSNGANTATIAGLGANTYAVTITDANTPQNSFTATYLLSEPSPLIINSITSNNINCFGSNSGSIDLDVSGGTAPYTFEWRDATNTIVSTNKDLNNLNVGTYTCTVRDNNNCTLVTSPVTISTNPQLAATLLGTTNVLINGQSTGAININVTGGFGTYNYAWSNGSTTQDLSNIPAGNYSLVVTDALGCTTVLNNIVITEPTALVVTPNILQTISCFGGNNGRITANASGGVGPYVYTWTFPNGTFSNQTIVSNRTAGIYNLQVRDVNNATQNITIVLSEPNELAGTFTSTPVSCGNNSDGSIAINPTGGSGTYSYLWSNGATTQTITNAAVGNYVVLVTDSNGCEKLFTGGQILAGGGITIQESIQDVTCISANSGSISLTVSGGSNQFSISWDDTALSGFTVTNLSGGIYSGTITDIVNNCTIPFSYSLSQPVNVSFNLPDTITLCKGQDTEINPNVIGNNLTYNWTADNGFSSTQPNITVINQGTYTLTVTSNNGCSFSDSVFVKVLSEAITSEYLVASQTYKDEEIILINVSDQTNETYEWMLPSKAIVISQNSQTAVIKFTEVGTYDIGLKATNNSGCVLYDYNQLVVEENPGLPEDTSNTITIKDFKIYPNPTTDSRFNVAVELAQSLPVSISIYQVSIGSLVNVTNFPSSKNHFKEYNLNVSSGVYYIVLRTPGNVQTKKLIIN